jgi:hypothetical protein
MNGIFSCVDAGIEKSLLSDIVVIEFLYNPTWIPRQKNPQATRRRNER